MKEVWNYTDYKIFISDIISSSKDLSKSALAKFCNCQSAYISQVLGAHAHLSLEQAYNAAEYLSLTISEQDFFLNLVQLNRSGTRDLQNYFKNKLKSLKDEHLNLSKRIKSQDKLTNDEQAYYLSSWLNMVIHLMTTIPKYKTEEDIAEALSLPVAKVKESIEFLITTGLIKKKKNGYKAGTTFSHITSSSHLLPLMHSNNRQLTIDTITRLKKQDFANNLIYSSIISLSEDDYNQIKEILISSIDKSKKIIKASKEEVLGVFNLDFIKLA